MDGIVPCLTRVDINFPAFVVAWLCPVWHSESLEDGPGSSVELDVTNTLSESVWMEVLSIDVIENIWLFVEFVNIAVFNSNAYIIIINLTISKLEQSQKTRPHEQD